MARFSGPQFRGAARQMKLQRRTEAEKRQAASRERMAKLQPLLGVVSVDELLAEVDMELLSMPEVEVKKTRVRRRGKHVAEEN